jgi:hypothetical protein
VKVQTDLKAGASLDEALRQANQQAFGWGADVTNQVVGGVTGFFGKAESQANDLVAGTLAAGKDAAGAVTGLFNIS